MAKKRSELDCLAAVRAFVRQARKVGTHSLARDLAYLEDLASLWHETPAWPPVGPPPPVVEAPGEESLLSFAAWCRPVLLQRDACWWRGMVDSLDTLAKVDGDSEARGQIKRLGTAWQAISDTRTSGRLIYATAGPILTDRQGQEVRAMKTNLELADGWFGLDAMHSSRHQEEAMNGFSLQQRYRAATHYVATIGLLVAQTLFAITTMRDRAFMAGLGTECFDEPVRVVHEREGSLPLEPVAPSTHPHPGDGTLGSDWVLGRPMFMNGRYCGPEEPMKGSPFCVA